MVCNGRALVIDGVRQRCGERAADATQHLVWRALPHAADTRDRPPRRLQAARSSTLALTPYRVVGAEFRQFGPTGGVFSAARLFRVTIQVRTHFLCGWPVCWQLG
jgi:hypothetical protein